MHYLKYKEHKAGSSKKQIKRVEKKAQHFSLENDVLKYRKELNGQFNLFVPPKSLRNEIITFYHLMGHFAKRATYKRINSRYYWPNMIKDIEQSLSKCTECIKFNKEKVFNHPAIALEVDNIFDRIGMDLVLGLPKTSRGNVGIMVITEYLSKYAWIYAIKSKEATEIANHFLEFICSYEPPKQILTDNGKEFINQIIEKITTAS